MVEMATPPHLSYFNVRGRAQMVGVMAAFVGQRIDYDWNPNWPAIRPQTPLGQLPVLRDGAVVLSQSMAIVRYLARKWNLQGSCTEDFALSEMLLEQASSLLDKLLVLSVPDDAKWHVFEQKDVPDHLEPLEQKLKGEQFCSQVCCGDLAVFAVLDLLQRVLGDPCLERWPNLCRFSQRFRAHPAIAEFLEIPLRNPVQRPVPRRRIKIGYWNVRGHAAPLRMLCVYAGLEFENVTYRIEGRTGQWDFSAWVHEKQNLQQDNSLVTLPYVSDGKTLVAHTQPCLRYLGHKCGLLSADSDSEAQWLWLGQELQWDCTRAFYTPRQKFDTGLFFTKTVPARLEKLAAWLETKTTDFLCGRSPTIADFRLCELLDQLCSFARALKRDDMLDAFPAVEAYLARFQSLPRIREYLSGPMHKLPISARPAWFTGVALDTRPGEAIGRLSRQASLASTCSDRHTAASVLATSSSASSRPPSLHSRAKEPLPRPEGVWLQKMGEGITGRKYRYFVLNGAEFVYYRDLVNGRPTERKGAIQLTRQTSPTVDGQRIVVRTPARDWDLLAESTTAAAKWAAILQEVVTGLCASTA
eukprot:m.253606 g.253606  ORF g.253606 m.253606 type:complete len:584 (-) comp19136_c0_seq7:224-1975(-)